MGASRSSEQAALFFRASKNLARFPRKKRCSVEAFCMSQRIYLSNKFQFAFRFKFLGPYQQKYTPQKFESKSEKNSPEKIFSYRKRFHKHPLLSHQNPDLLAEETWCSWQLACTKDMPSMYSINDFSRL